MYLVFCWFVLSRSLVAVRTPYEVSPPDFAERVEFRSARDDVPLTGWRLPATGSRAIVMLHGLDGSAWSGAEPDIARAYVEAGFHVLLFDLRGQGRSGEAPLGLGWHERDDVRAAVDVLLESGFEPGRIGLHGTSYGAATALLSAAVIPEVGAVLADSAFADMRDLMDNEIERRTGVPAQLSRLALRPGISFLARQLHALDFDAIAPETAVSRIAPRPILFVHGEQDTVIPVEHVHRLKEAATGTHDTVWVLPALGHTEGVWIWKQPREVSPLRKAFLRRIVAFFDRSLEKRSKRAASAP